MGPKNNDFPVHTGSLVGGRLDFDPSETIFQSHDLHEIERKYLPPSHRKSVRQVDAMLLGHSDWSVKRFSFDGPTQYVIAHVGDQKIEYRYRESSAKSEPQFTVKMQIETRDGHSNLIRGEASLKLQPQNSLKSIRAILGSIALIDPNHSFFSIESRGIIWLVEGGTLRSSEKIEFVIYTNIRRLPSERVVVAAEIEAIGFKNQKRALQYINYFEAMLSWKKYQTKHSLSELFDPAEEKFNGKEKNEKANSVVHLC